VSRPQYLSALFYAAIALTLVAGFGSLLIALGAHGPEVQGEPAGGSGKLLSSSGDVPRDQD
jgi:hypothetical protein